MSEAVKIVTLINITFVIMLMLSGSIGGWLGETVYYLAFLIALFFANSVSDKLKNKREEKNGLAEDYNTFLGFDGRRAIKLLPLIAPVVAVVFLTSLLSSLILSLLGVTSAPVENEGVIKMLFAHAVLPAVLEEMMFRYIPLRLLKPYSHRWCVIYSAICFALIHCSLAQMPYAFVAGIIFMVIDIAFDSVLPSLILHFINNAASVIWIKYCSSMGASLIFIAVLASLAVISLVFLFRQRKEYKEDISTAFEAGERMPTTYAPFALAVICLYVALASI